MVQRRMSMRFSLWTLNRGDGFSKVPVFKVIWMAGGVNNETYKASTEWRCWWTTNEVQMVPS